MFGGYLDGVTFWWVHQVVLPTTPEKKMAL